MLRLSSFRPSKKILRTSLLCLALGLSACNNNVEEFQTEGQKLMKEGNPNGAIVFFRNALDEDANNFSLRYDLLKAYIQAEKYPQAEAELSKCLLQEPNNIELLQTAANFYTNLQENVKALEYIDKIEALQKPTALTRELAAANYRVLGKNSEAEEAYKAALTLEPTRVTSQINLVTLYLASNRMQEGQSLLSKTLSENPNNINALQLHALLSEDTGNFLEAENAYNKIIGLLPNPNGASFSLAKVFLKQGKIQEAIEINKKMRATYPDDMPTILLSGMLAYQDNKFDEAVSLLQQAVQLAPSVDGLYYLSRALNQSGNSESALSNLRRILDVQANHRPSMMLTAEILQAQQRYQEAEYEVTRLLKAHPQDALAYNLLGDIQKNLKEYDKALVSYEKALKLNTKLSQAALSRTNIYLEQNQEEKALSELKTRFEQDAENTAIIAALFNFHMKQKNYEEAAVVIDKALEAQQNHPLYLTMKASLYASTQQNEQATDMLRKAIAADPNFLPATQLLLNVYLLQNNNAEALELCNNYLEKDPNNTDFLVTSAVVLDKLDRQDEATERLSKANKLGSDRALLSLVRRALSAKDTIAAEKFITDTLQERPAPALRSMLANFYLEQDGIQKALDVYQEESIKNTPEAFLNKFKLYVAVKNYDEAQKQADHIINAMKQSPDGYVLKAMTLEHTGNFDEAFKTLEEAYNKTSSTSILLQLGNLCLRNGRTDKALSYFRTTLLKDPNNKDALAGQSYAFLQQRDYEKAIAGYEKIFELYPNDQVNINNLAMAYAEQGEDTARAVELATKIFIAHPENPSVVDTYAFTLLENKQVQEAINILEGGLLSNPTSGQLHYRYGLALLANEQIAEGVAALEKAVELGRFNELEKAKELIETNT